MLKLQYFGHLMQRANLLEKTLMLWRQKKGVTEDEMVGWHHRLNRHESEQAPGDGEGQGSLACCSPWGCKESDATEWLNNNKMSQDPLVTSSFGKTCDIVVQFFQWPLEGTISWFTASPHKDDLDYVLKSEHLKKKKKQTTDITLSTKVHIAKATVFPVVMYGCESWTIKKAERRRTDAFERWCWRILLRVS